MSSKPSKATKPATPPAPVAKTPTDAERDAAREEALSALHTKITELRARAEEGDADATAELQSIRTLAAAALSALADEPEPAAPAEAYVPTGKVRVVAESDTARVLEDDVRRWVEAK